MWGGYRQGGARWTWVGDRVWVGWAAVYVGWPGKASPRWRWGRELNGVGSETADLGGGPIGGTGRTMGWSSAREGAS